MDLDPSLLQTEITAAKRIRELLHEHPEAAYHETFTTSEIRKKTEACREFLRENPGKQLEIIELGMETGLVCLLNAGKAETIALRADIDSVETETGHKHLCGHDYHTSTLLGAMGYLCRTETELPYNVLFIFQPAEEPTDGAKAMLAHQLMEKLPQVPVRLFGIHNRPELPVGKIAVHQGSLMAEKNNYRVTFKGKAGHGGTPHHCIDPITGAAQFILAMQSVVSKNVDPFDNAICGVFSIHSGTEVNNPPDDAVLTGTIRSLSHEAFVRMIERVECIARSCAACYECSAELEWIPLVPLLYNSEEMTGLAYRAAKDTVGEENIVDTKPTLASDDFAVFGQKMPSFYYWVGSGPSEPGQPGGRPWHDPGFCIAPGYLNIAIPLLIQAALGA
ncbi:MAG: amidohydrolase [Solobacterium sp.]|nr:amidohydrolase [Solobacterium sp.]